MYDSYVFFLPTLIAPISNIFGFLYTKKKFFMISSSAAASLAKRKENETWKRDTDACQARNTGLKVTFISGSQIIIIQTERMVLPMARPASMYNVQLQLQPPSRAHCSAQWGSCSAVLLFSCSPHWGSPCPLLAALICRVLNKFVVGPGKLVAL